MTKISDEIRGFVRRSYEDEYMDPKELLALADRIDAEMVELPKDADGVPVHLNDTVYDSRGYECHVNSMTLYSNGDDATVRVGDGVCSTAVTTYVLTHKRPDSLERIADELNDWRKGAVEERRIRTSDNDDVNDFIDRIRKFAKERRDE